MAVLYNFGNPNARKEGFNFISADKYLQDPFKAPVREVEKIQTTFGIPATNAFTGGGGSGANFYPGSPSNLVTDYQTTVDNRQNRLNNPSDTFLGFNTMRDQQLTGADAGEYIGSGTAIPREQTMMGKVQSFFAPQSAQSIIDDGYQEPRFQPGIIGMLAGKIDNYRNLPEIDQAFIAQNMGYTGPTVFGENPSGLSKDPFGLNTRSAFGNYGERVGVEVDKLSDALSSTGAIGGKSAYKGATFNVETGMFEADDEDDPKAVAAALKANQMTKMVRTKLSFYRGKVKERDEIQNQINERNAAEAKAAAAGGDRAAQAAQRARDERTITEANRAFRAGDDSAYSSGIAGEQKDGSYNDPFDPGGGEKDGGFIDGSNRRPFAYGGLASIL
tara:strand:+ start:808 stop:1971 length:1164 start_codon:yes stop_codon:yes gene_type:complete